MNTTKRVAWHKHLKKAKKHQEKAHAAQPGGAAPSGSAHTPPRPAASRR
jgi:hypothetical protein